MLYSEYLTRSRVEPPSDGQTRGGIGAEHLLPGLALGDDVRDTGGRVTGLPATDDREARVAPPAKEIMTTTTDSRPQARAIIITVLVAAAAVVVATLSLAVPAHAAASGVQIRIAKALTTQYISPRTTSIEVWDQTANRLVYSLNATSPRVPASNLKLATAATALTLWGASHRFKTELFASALPVKWPAGIGELNGNIYLKGFGDPSLSTVTYQRQVLEMKTSSLESFVTSLKRLGVTCITGSVVADDSYFDRLRSCPGWRPDFVEDQIGSLSALTLNEGESESGTPVMSSPLFAAAELTTMIEQAGIPVDGTPYIGTVPAGSVLVHTDLSAPLATLLRHMDQWSDNFFAEMFAKGLGASFGGAGTTAAGVGVIRGFLADCGIAGTNVRIYDGSGLSYWDRLSAAGVTQLLRIMAAGPDARPYTASLSIAGKDGTLVERMRHTAAQNNLIGKTGTLDVASCLSGYVTSANHHHLVFSLLMNGAPVPEDNAITAQDDIGVALATASLPGG
jgi:D-alanyl-D-alanine carboxypeptidase/D-alanyl-D-alanine-endopeptidase (penicillin-binding protein 4)